MSAVLTSWRTWVFAAWAAAALFVHFRSRVRLLWKRQLVDHSTFLAPYNALIYLFEGRGERRGPFLDLALRPELDVLREPENWRAIRDEARALLDAGRCTVSAEHQDLAFNTFFHRGWTRFYVKWYGRELPSAVAECPRTAALLRSLPTVRAALFAVLPPGARLGKHRDPFAGSLRYHLGLITPGDDGCWIEVDGERYSWRDGEAVLFDETFVHKAKNETERERVILFCDVERPIRFAPLRWLNRFLASYVLPITQARNEPGEPLGFANRIAGFVFGLSKRIARLRNVSPTLYVSLKLLVVAAVIWLVFFS